jgi:hypothetical protein
MSDDFEKPCHQELPSVEGPMIHRLKQQADRIEKLEGQKETYYNAFIKSAVRIKELEDALGLMVEYVPTTIEDLNRARRILHKKLTCYEAGFSKMVDEWRGRRAADRIEKLESALRTIYDCCDETGNCSVVRRIVRKVLEGNPEKSVYKEGYRAVEEAMGHPSPEFWVERK